MLARIFTEIRKANRGRFIQVGNESLNIDHIRRVRDKPSSRRVHVYYDLNKSLIFRDSDRESFLKQYQEFQ